MLTNLQIYISLVYTYGKVLENKNTVKPRKMASEKRQIFQVNSSLHFTFSVSLIIYLL